MSGTRLVGRNGRGRTLGIVPGQRVCLARDPGGGRGRSGDVEMGDEHALCECEGEEEGGGEDGESHFLVVGGFLAFPDCDHHDFSVCHSFCLEACARILSFDDAFKSSSLLFTPLP